MDVHKIDRLLTCIFCKEDFPNRAAYRKHLLLHTGSKPFVCTTCEKRFTSKSCLTQHMLTHSTKDAAFPCTSCDKKFKSQTSLTKHMATHEVPDEEEKQQQHACQKCKRVFKHATNLQKHEANCTGVKKEGKKRKDKVVDNYNAEVTENSSGEKSSPRKSETQTKPRKKRKPQKTIIKDENSNVVSSNDAVLSSSKNDADEMDSKRPLVVVTSSAYSQLDSIEATHQTIDMSVLRPSQPIVDSLASSTVSSTGDAVTTFNLLSSTSSHM